MSQAMTAQQLVNVLNKAGIGWRAYKADWRTHNRPGEWGDMHGVGIHNTASAASDPAELNTAYVGRSDLPGPLYNIVITDDGMAWLIGWGRANHFGSGDKDVYAAVVAESYGTNPPKPNDKTVDGNSHFYGVSMAYLREPTSRQLRTCERVAAAICRYHKWSAKSVIAHREWSYTRSDPTAVTMATFRGLVQHLLNS